LKEAKGEAPRTAQKEGKGERACAPDGGWPLDGGRTIKEEPHGWIRRMEKVNREKRETARRNELMSKEGKKSRSRCLTVIRWRGGRENGGIW